jgi:hypothetical protein
MKVGTGQMRWHRAAPRLVDRLIVLHRRMLANRLGLPRGTKEVKRNALLTSMQFAADTMFTPRIASSLLLRGEDTSAAMRLENPQDKPKENLRRRSRHWPVALRPGQSPKGQS